MIIKEGSHEIEIKEVEIDRMVDTGSSSPHWTKIYMNISSNYPLSDKQKEILEEEIIKRLSIE